MYIIILCLHHVYRHLLCCIYVYLVYMSCIHILNYLIVNYSARLEIYSALWLLVLHNYNTCTVFCPGYLEWWLDSTSVYILMLSQ